jgi:uncharacterized protein with GYD domain
MLSTVGPNGAATLREHPERLRQVNAEVQSMGGRVVAQYALLGQWDFLNIIEAPDEVVMARIATMLSARGTLKTRTLVAVDIEQYLAALADDT